MANLFASSVSTETDFVYVKSIKWYRLGGDTRTQTLNTDSTLRTRPEMKRDELTAHRLRKNRLFYFFFSLLIQLLAWIFWIKFNIRLFQTKCVALTTGFISMVFPLIFLQMHTKIQKTNFLLFLSLIDKIILNLYFAKSTNSDVTKNFWMMFEHVLYDF